MTARLVGINHVALEVEDLDARSTSTAASSTFACAAGCTVRRSSTSATSSSRSCRAGPAARRRATFRARRRRQGGDAAGSPRPACRVLLPGRGLDFLDPDGNRIEIVQYDQIQFTKTRGGAGGWVGAREDRAGARGAA